MFISRGYAFSDSVFDLYITSCCFTAASWVVQHSASKKNSGLQLRVPSSRIRIPSKFSSRSSSSISISSFSTHSASVPAMLNSNLVLFSRFRADSTLPTLFKLSSMKFNVMLGHGTKCCK